jgi:Rps23 Pro-64 3,4-dihydroxylase Tpa1-like proline 4-hydroxylase
MLRVHSEGRRYTVYDEMFDCDQLQDARNAVSSSTLTPALSPINRIHDGLAFKAYGPRGHLKADFSDLDRSDVVQQLAATCIRTVGTNSACDDTLTWAYSSTYMAYTIGTQLSWHDDRDADWAGVFTFYLDSWSSEWGGELDIIDCDSNELPPCGTHEESVVHAPLNATTVFPRSNRVVVMRSGTLHRVRRVDQLAGSNVRRTISGSVWITETNGCPAPSSS